MKRIYIDGIKIGRGTFELYNRAKHIFLEAKRVLQFRNAIFENKPSLLQVDPHPFININTV